MIMQKKIIIIFFVEELVKVVVNIAEEHNFMVEILQLILFSMEKSLTKDKV
jgi:hypothetical protein